MKRYIVEMSFYIRAESDMDAVIQANEIAKMRRDMFDDSSRADKLYEAPAGLTGAREINMEIIDKSKAL